MTTWSEHWCTLDCRRRTTDRQGDDVEQLSGIQQKQERAKNTALRQGRHLTVVGDLLAASLNERPDSRERISTNAEWTSNAELISNMHKFKTVNITLWCINNSNCTVKIIRSQYLYVTKVSRDIYRLVDWSAFNGTFNADRLCLAYIYSIKI